MSWRPADERLLRRLEDESLFERAWDALTPEGTEPPHPRASGVLVALREDPDTAPILDAADRGDLASLLHALHQPDLEALRPKHAHHLALIWGRVADVLETSHRGGSTRARQRSLSMWAWLAQEERYLGDLAERVIGEALPAPEVERAAREAPAQSIDALGARAREGAEELTEASAAALAALASVPQACADAKVSDELARRLQARARRHREASIDDAIARVDASFEQAVLDDAPTREIVGLTEDAARVWRWSGHDELVERFLVQRVTPVIWDRYRDQAWHDVAALLAPLRGAVESLARRIAADPSKLAYAAPCAQMYVFMAEVAPQFDEQLALAERAVGLCETHRNGRLVLADLLVERGLRKLDRAVPFGWSSALDEAAKDIRRAEGLYPQLKRLESAKRRLRVKGIDLDAD